MLQVSKPTVGLCLTIFNLLLEKFWHSGQWRILRIELNMLVFIMNVFAAETV